MSMMRKTEDANPSLPEDDGGPWDFEDEPAPVGVAEDRTRTLRLMPVEPLTIFDGEFSDRDTAGTWLRKFEETSYACQWSDEETRRRFRLYTTKYVQEWVSQLESPQKRMACMVERPVIPNLRFDVLAISDTDCERKFRFDRNGITELTHLLKVPLVLVTEAGDRCSGIKGLCILLNRLSYPRRYCDMIATFGRSRESLCRISNFLVDLLYDQWHGLLYFCLHIVEHGLESYSDAVRAKGAMMNNIFGFIDGSKIETCRISHKRGTRGNIDSRHGDLQRIIYCGHKRRHCLTFQAITTPDGLCAHFWDLADSSFLSLCWRRSNKNRFWAFFPSKLRRVNSSEDRSFSAIRSQALVASLRCWNGRLPQESHSSSERLLAESNQLSKLVD
ncbi:hypothetical protein LEN26_006985 [Aphanomyces euteiches]|nr:hypothetical protein LEN26_006985 [Aphanomyces euteiches]